MLFRQIDEILLGQKTQTRRVCKPGEDWTWGAAVAEQYPKLPDHEGRYTLVGVPIDEVPQAPIYTVTTGGRVKWQVGRTYAVQRKRGLAGLWYKAARNGNLIHVDLSDGKPFDTDNWHPLRVRLTAIHREPLHAITDEDAAAEGCEPLYVEDTEVITARDEYRELWDRINTRKGTRWADNPDVWVLTFEVVR